MGRLPKSNSLEIVLSRDILLKMKVERIKRDISQETVAYDLGIKTNWYQRIECGMVIPSPRTMYEIGVYFDIPELTSILSAIVTGKQSLEIYPF